MTARRGIVRDVINIRGQTARDGGNIKMNQGNKIMKNNKGIKIFAWTLAWQKKQSPKEIIDEIADKYDIIILNEFKMCEPYLEIVRELEKCGYLHRHACMRQIETGDYSHWRNWCLTFVAVRKSFFDDSVINAANSIIPDDFIREKAQDIDGLWGRNWLEITLKNLNTTGLDGELNILAVKVPSGKESEAARECYLAHLSDYADKNKDKQTVLIGDFNSCTSNDTDEKNTLEDAAPVFQALKSTWVDAWETAGNKLSNDDRFTYSSGISGRRLDYAFLSPGLEGHLLSAGHLHDVRRRCLSDHSALVIELI